MKTKTIIFLTLFSLTITSCAHAGLKISCSLFPVYDFARQITGNLAEVSLLLKPGTEPHEFEPSPLDVKALNDSDVFIFTGRMMEHWAEKLSGTLTNTRTIDASENISLTDNDPHVWLDLSLAQKMIYTILEGLCKVDPENSQAYIHNAADYCKSLAELDEKFAALPKDKALVFAGEFSCGYFVRRYGFDYISAYDGENEPGIKRMGEIIRYIRDHHTSCILSDVPVTRVTQAIADQTHTEILTFSTAHNLPDTSQTYLQIMTGNYANISRLLND